MDTTKDGSLIVSTSDDCTIKLWKKSSEMTDEENLGFKCIKTLSNWHLRSIYTCSLNYDGSLLATVISYFKYFYYF